MKTEPFDGRASEMRKSTWLASEDLAGLGDVEVEILRVHRNHDVEFEAGRKEKVVYSLEFKGANRQLVLNSANRKRLAGLFGSDVKAWSGKKVKLYVDTNVKLMGKTTSGIRIR
jgi:endo-1,4-beta-mannosidase